ncbi:BglG family transcription antiterminator [Salibacterium salarium]|uniref:BglG family transcription antiterminator n=1 Tax=Salibacterium salarium TaxID=284579 RepID=UPI001639A28D|nr:BglG family transcription antiterminator [Salibacterium salarium]
MPTNFMSARERELLNYLLKYDEETPVSTVAKELNVSSRTIHRDLKGVEQTLKSYHLELMKATGKGIKIQGSPENKQELELALLQPSAVEYTGEERRTLILCSLLENTEPIKLNSLAIDLKVTVATISYDLDKLEEWFSNSDLTLVRRRGFGVKIDGTESAKRAAMSQLIAENFMESDLFRVMRESIKNKAASTGTNTISDRLLGLVEQDKWVMVEKILADMSEELPYSFADSAYIGLVVHLTLAMERISQGENIEINEAYLDSLRDTREFEVAQFIISKLEKVFHLTVPEAEVGYITMHLRGAKLREDQDHRLDLDHFSSAVHARTLMKYIQRETGEPLLEDNSLYQGLIAHLEPALYRIRENMAIHNPLLKEIKRDYFELFQMVKRAADESFQEIKLPDSEIGFLVLHFGSALEKIQNVHKVNALVVCSSGIGSSKMLVTRLRKEIPEIDELKSISMMDLEQEYEAFDFIISTLELSNEEYPSIVVNPFLSEKDVDRVRQFIKQLTKGHHPRTETKDKVRSIEQTSTHHSYESTIQELASFQLYSKTIVHLLKTFRVLTWTDSTEVYSILKEACTEIENDSSSSEKITEKLWARYEMGGVAIPGSTLALFHTRSNVVKEPCFQIKPLHASLPIHAMDGTTTNVDCFLMLLAPVDEPPEVYEVLSAISGQIIESEESLTLFTSADERKIKEHMSQAFREWLTQKL